MSPLVVEEPSRTKDEAVRAALLGNLGSVSPDLVKYGSVPEQMAREFLAASRWKESRLADMTHIAYTLLSKADALVTWDTDDLARARHKDPMTVEVKRIRRKISREMMEAHRQGRLGQYMKDMERKAEQALHQASARAKRKKRAQA